MQPKIVLSHQRMRKRKTAADKQDRKGLVNNYSTPAKHHREKKTQKQNLWSSPTPASKGHVRKEPRLPPWQGCNESPNIPTGCWQRRPRKEPRLSLPLVSMEIIWEPGHPHLPHNNGVFLPSCCTWWKEESPISGNNRSQLGNLDFFLHLAVSNKAEPLSFPVSEKAS